MNKFMFKTEPYKHQLDCFERGKDRVAYALFAEMGTGKSKMVLDHVGWLWYQNKVESVLIVAPKGVYRNWLDKEVPQHLCASIDIAAACWNSDASTREQQEIDRFLATKTRDKLRIFVFNVEAFGSKRALEALAKFLKSSPNLMTIVDESTCIKNPTAERTKMVLRIGDKYSKYRRILSGEPAANSPLDLYSQMKFLDWKILQASSFAAFRSQHAITVDRKTSNNRTYQQIVGYKNTEELQRLVAPHAFIVKKADCLDLPAKIYQTIDVAMGTNQRRAYEEMLEYSISMLSGKQISDDIPEDVDEDDLVNQAQLATTRQTSNSITASEVIVQLLRLHQISCGFAKLDDGREVDFEETNDRMEQLVENLKRCSGKAIVWATYRHSIQSIVARLKKEFGDDSVVDYWGATPEDLRRIAIKLFQDPASSVRFFVGNPQTAGYGITLTEAELVVYYANSYDNEKRVQSEDRAHRIGQKKSVVYLDLVARGTVDEKILRILKKKQKLSDEVTASNWQTLFE